jgi:hypothetical protein
VLAAAAVTTVGAIALVAPPATLPLLTPACALSTPDGDVGLSREQARAATDAAATALRDGTAPVAGPDEDVARAAVALHAGAQEALACRATRPAQVGEPEGPGGLTPRAQTAREALEGAFGRQALGGFAPGGVRSGHIAESAHYEGRAVDVFFRPVTPEGTARGWAVAQWTVAHADDLGVATVIFDRRIWSASRSWQGWRTYRHPSGNDADPVLAHEDHVHLDVGR